MNWLKQLPWRRLLLIFVTGAVSYFLVPVILSRYNDFKALRDTRLTTALKFGDRNDEFNRKINATATLLRMFGTHNYRMKISGTDLQEARKELSKDYRERYLDLDATVWWGPADFVRETAGLDLLSPEEMKQLDAAIQDYNKSVLATMNQVIILWQFLDSPEYKADEQSKKKIDDLEATMDQEFQRQHEIRDEMVNKISAVFRRSNYRTGWRDLVAFWR
jgi:hypothetical protein